MSAPASRSVLCLLSVAALLATACSTTRYEPEPIQVTRPAYRPYGRAGTAYVRVRGGSPDAVILHEPDQWSEVVVPLEYGQAVVVEGRSGLYAYVHTRDLGVNFEGWVLKSVLAKHVPDNPHEPADGVSAATAADYLYPYEEFPDEPLMQANLSRLDEYEARLDHIKGGDPVNPDSQIIRERYQAWGRAGGLLPDDDD